MMFRSPHNACGYSWPGSKNYWGSLLAVFIGGLLSVRATIPQAAKDDPRYKLGFLVVSHYAGVNTNGTADSLAGLQAAVNDAYTNGLVALFPSGTYLISDTLRCRAYHLASGTNADGSIKIGANPCSTRSFTLQGSSCGPRPVIKLADLPVGNFDSTTSPRPLLMFRLYHATQYPNAPPVEPPDTNILVAPPGYSVDSSYLFDWELRNLDFDCNRHAGAVAVVFPAAQGSLIANVRVNATNAFAGFYGLPGRNWGAVNIEVDGGRYGIRTGLSVAGEYGAGSSVFGARLIGQTVAAIDHDDFAPLIMAGFQISKAAGPVFTLKTGNFSSFHTMSLLDGSIEITGSSASAPAISNTNGKSLYLRNVYIGGATNLLKSTTLPALTGAGLWSRIDEYSYADQRTTTGLNTFTTRSMIDGVMSTTAERVKLATTNSGSPPLDLVARHLPAHGMPTYEGTGSPATIVVTDPPYNAIPGDTISDTLAIQQAIDAASTAGHGRVFIPKFNTNGTLSGAFLLTNTITLRSNTVLFGAAKGYVSELGAHANWKPAVVTSIVQTEDTASGSTYLGNLALTTQGSLYRYPFTFYHWRAGAASETFDLRIDPLYEYNPPPNSNHYAGVRLSGNAGGRHFFFPEGAMDQVGNTTTVYPSNNGNQYRSLRIVNTTQPLWLYGFNLEGGKHDYRQYDAEIIGATNIRWLGWKREGSSSMLLLSNSQNIALYSAGAMREEPKPGLGQFEIYGSSTNLLMANLLVQVVETNTSLGLTLKESLTGQPTNIIAYPEGVSLYKRGIIDDSAMRLPPAMPDTLTAIPRSGARLDLAWNDGAGTTGYLLERKTGASAYSRIASLAGGATYYADTNLASATTYTYRLLATNSGGTSPPSTEAIAATLPNQPPTLAAVSNFSIMAGFTLNITNMATDPEAPPQTLTFTLLSAPTNASLNAASGVFSWRPLAVQANSTNAIRLMVSDNGTPTLSATQSFTLVVNHVARPLLAAPTFTNGHFRLLVSGDFGPDYLLQSSDNLTNWTTWQMTNSPTPPFWMILTGMNSSANRFFRLNLP
jgi:hypothetical protein